MRVVKIAQDLFIDEGVAATSVNRIAKEAGLTPMSVYRYFGTKDGLVIAAWRDALAQFYEKFMERYTRRSKNLQTGFEKYVACMEEYTNAYTEFPKWYAYTREMLSYAMEENIETELNINDVFSLPTGRYLSRRSLRCARGSPTARSGRTLIST